MDRTVILTDEQGTALGMCPILEAHTGQGRLHRAFSAYIFSPDGTQILIQRRAKEKMLWPGFWANTCCSHPFEDESPSQAGERRLKEEFGFSVPLKPMNSFVYRAKDPTGRGVEHEHVTILTGTYNPSNSITVDPQEIQEYCWMNIDDLRKEMNKHPDRFAPWFHLGLKLLMNNEKVAGY